MKPWKIKKEDPQTVPMAPSVSGMHQSILLPVMMSPPGGGIVGTNYYLHDPNFAESVHIGKMSAMGGGQPSWFTDIHYSDGHWKDTQSLIEYLRNLEAESTVTSIDGTPRYIAWVSSEYAEVCMPGQMADDILRCYDHQTASGTFS